MSKIAELMAKNAAIKEAQAAGAIPGATTAKSTIDTGLQSSIEQVQAAAPSLEIPKPVMDEKLAANSLGVYEATYLKKFFRPDGAVVHNAINGFFYAKDEIDLTELEHFAALGKIVRVEEKQEAKK